MDYLSRKWKFSHMIARHLMFLVLIMMSGTVNAELRCENFSPNMWVGLNYDKLIEAGEYKGNRLTPLPGFSRSWEGGYRRRLLTRINVLNRDTQSQISCDRQSSS
jgi:hypothetical protein